MNDILKQRLVGALILVALGVVFWPIIFVVPGEQPALEQARIPALPGVDTTPVQTPDLAGLRPSPQLQFPTEVEEPAQTPAAIPANPPEPAHAPGEERAEEPVAPVPAEPPTVTRTRSTAPEVPRIDAQGIPVAWILRVASVSSAEKAEELKGRLLLIEQKAYVKRVKSGNKDLYRVYIGPKFEKARLEAVQKKIDDEFGVTSLITRYVP